jgi:hypothetical protein
MLSFVLALACALVLLAGCSGSKKNDCGQPLDGEAFPAP